MHPTLTSILTTSAVGRGKAFPKYSSAGVFIVISIACSSATGYAEKSNKHSRFVSGQGNQNEYFINFLNLAGDSRRFTWNKA
jgi:hypothetical protein